MTKSELIERIVTHQGLLSSKDVELAIKTMLEQMSQCLATGDRIEIRGFGSFSLHYRAPRVGRNPKTGESVRLDGKFVPHPLEEYTPWDQVPLTEYLREAKEINDWRKSKGMEHRDY